MEKGGSRFTLHIQCKNETTINQLCTPLQVWEIIPSLIEERRVKLFLERQHAPNDRSYILAMQQEQRGEEDEEVEGEGMDDGWESDESDELGFGCYGEEVDSDHEPVMDVIQLSDVEDEESEEEEDGDDGTGSSSGSEWNEGDVEEIATVGRRGRGMGRGRGGRGRGSAAAQLGKACQRKKDEEEDSDSDCNPTPAKRGRSKRQ